MSGCSFCAILAGDSEATFVWRDDLVSAFMDIQPINAGHILLVPNTHASALADVPAETAARLMQAAQRLAQALRESGLRCDGVSLFLADGEAAGQDVFHTHLHVFPRYRGDGFGLRLGPDYLNRPSRPELDRVGQLIRSALA